jgi:hypothetical protein
VQTVREKGRYFNKFDAFLLFRAAWSTGCAAMAHAVDR